MTNGLASPERVRAVQLIPVPVEAQHQLQELVVEHERARRALGKYVHSLGVVIGLPPNSMFHVDTDKMVIALEILVAPPAGGHEPEVED